MTTQEYLDELRAHLRTGEAREHTYRPAQAAFFESFLDIQAANDQARTEHGATDFVFRRRSNLDVVLGYAEAKDIYVNLDKTEKTEQIERYAGYNNLILTNYIEFRFYRNGKRYARIEIAKLNGLDLEPLTQNFQLLIDEVAAFFEQPPEVIKSGKRLSEIMGAKARRIRNNVNILLKLNAADSARASEITKVYGLMRSLLVHDLEPDMFADMYAQTLVYGLFVARYNDRTPDTFTRSEARDLIPPSNPFLREFFDHIAGPRFEKGLSIIVDELCQVFSVSNVNEIITKHLKLDDSRQADAKDPIIHFYEDFLGEYNPDERKKMGAYYTPIPVVRYMVRAVDEVLRNSFGIVEGLADVSTELRDVEVQGKKAKRAYHRVQVLDPATGTATFLNEVIKFVANQFQGQEGMWQDYARKNLIPRLHGFELMMGAYTIAHLKLGLTLQNLGVKDIGERLGIYLTNSLEEGIPHQPDLFSFGLAEAVTFESAEAAHIKSERPIMIVIGNPPYSGISSNNTQFANAFVNKYKFEPGGKQKLNERNPKWLNDDYVKFIAFAEDLIIKNGEGVLAFITNHGYLDNPTFRGMRWHLAQTFDEIKIIDLHGNSKKKETTPDGAKDENIFDIQQGVSIIIATKTKRKNKAMALVRVADLYGKRIGKFETLNSDSINFVQIQIDPKQYYFTKKNIEGKEQYESGFSVNDIFLLKNVGIVTSADSVLIADDASNLLEQLSKTKELESEKKISKRLKSHEIDAGNIQRIAYRPFDRRSLYYSAAVVERTRIDVMKHFMLGENLGLVFKRGDIEEKSGAVFVTNSLIDFRSWSRPGMQGGDYVAPMYVYDSIGSKSSNLDKKILAIVRRSVDCQEEEVFDYIYGILHWPEYREKYKEFLKTDFPRVPYPTDQKEFEHFRCAGEKLRSLHLMTDPSLAHLITTYPVAGDNIVTKLSYSDERVYISNTQYFGGVPETAWKLYIGGYQPAQKWLKDRKGRALNYQDIKHYQMIIKVLVETSKLVESL